MFGLPPLGQSLLRLMCSKQGSALLVEKKTLSFVSDRPGAGPSEHRKDSDSSSPKPLLSPGQTSVWIFEAESYLESKYGNQPLPVKPGLPNFQSSSSSSNRTGLLMIDLPVTSDAFPRKGSFSLLMTALSCCFSVPAGPVYPLSTTCPALNIHGHRDPSCFDLCR
jgi:hypothetical protein